jgi:hypothetical protein
MLIATFPQGKAEYRRIFKRKDIGLTVPDNGKQHVQVLHDWQITLANGEQNTSRAAGHRTAHPAIVNTKWGLVTKYNDKVYDYVELPEKWQWLIWEFCKWSTDYQMPDGQITSYYTKTTNSGIFAKSTPYSTMEYYVSIMEKSRAWTDSWSPEIGGRDYVTGRNPNNRPLEFLIRHTTGALHEVRPFGSKWIVKALDITKDPPPFANIIADPTLWYWATQIGNVPLPDKTWQVSYFPQAKYPSEHYGLPFKGVAMPLLSLGGDFMIDKKACTPVLVPGSKWSPYNP